MRVLTVPNWSFGRDQDLMKRFRDCFPADGLDLHYLDADLDHNRTVVAFSGELSLVLEKLRELCALALERIDLNRHIGVHPRIGALDVCPFVTLPTWNVPFEILDEAVRNFGEELAESYELPVFLYEKSERGRHEADLPTLRKGGFGGLSGRELNPDFGPSVAHPTLGVTIMGVRDFLIAFNVNLAAVDVLLARKLAKQMREGREAGDARFLGVRALGFPLHSRFLSQVSINLTLPDLTAVDPIVEWVQRQASDSSVKVSGTELIGVIRSCDLVNSSRLPIKPAQVVE